MSFVIFETGGKQYRASKGAKLQIERLPEETGETVVFPYVLLSANGEDVQIGAPFLSGVTVEGKIVDQDRGDKIRVVKKKAKKRFHKVQGHRQYYTEVEITNIGSATAA